MISLFLKVIPRFLLVRRLTQILKTVLYEVPVNCAVHRVTFPKGERSDD